MLLRIVLVFFCAASLFACNEPALSAPSLSKERVAPPTEFERGEHFPKTSEAATVGRISRRISRQSRDFGTLVQSQSDHIVFKDEEQTGADRIMTRQVRTRLHRLAELVRKEWPGVSVRVTEAWDENGEHGENSIHYEGRALDLTTSDLDSGKLGRLAALAVEAGFDWVYYEASHIHASVDD